MSNIGYCRFQNTERDLRDCYEHLSDEELSVEEERTRERLIELCKLVVVERGYE